MTESEKIKRELKIYIEMNGNDSTTYQNFWNIAKAVMKIKFILQADLPKQE